MGDDAPIDWVHRDERFGEKLATPDTSIADLIGEVDPIKVAEGRYLSDELTLHYGLVPRTNRGIFAINELPDLAERIQVGLLNVLEERDVQIRGYKVRLPLDVLLVASANPEDYTNRGRIITPLKDRFGAQIRTHYPLDVDTEVAIALQEARPLEAPGVEVRGARRSWPRSSPSSRQLARRSPHINQRSGVSVRLTVANLETLVANAARRTLHPRRDRRRAPRLRPRRPRRPPPPARSRSRPSRRAATSRSSSSSSRPPCSRCSASTSPSRTSARSSTPSTGDRVVHAGEDVTSSDYVDLLADVARAARARAGARAPATTSPAVVASAVEFVLEGLHLSKRLNKDAVGARAQYRGRG